MPSSGGCAVVSLGAPLGFPVAVGGLADGLVALQQSIEVDVVNDAFRPWVIQAELGQPLVIRLRNKGLTAHTFTQYDTGTDVVVARGERRTVTVRPPAQATSCGRDARRAHVRPGGAGAARPTLEPAMRAVDVVLRPVAGTTSSTPATAPCAWYRLRPARAPTRHRPPAQGR